MNTHERPPPKLGKYNVEFNAANLASGIYLYELRADDFVTSKMLLIK